ncbi:hypothetical protein JCM10213_003309, partial [Rhodosporidiobolus nylandii]
NLRGALTTLASACVSLKASGKGSLTVSIVAKLLIELILAVHVALADIISLASSVPLLIVFLAGELLAISAQLVLACNALFALFGAELKAAVAASVQGSVVAGFKTLGCWSFVSIIQL